MGCDIHPNVEVRDPATGKWSAAHADFGPLWEGSEYRAKGPFDWRSYSMFGVLVGDHPRNDGIIQGIVKEARGIPEDSPLYGDEEANHGDWHTHSYLTLKELLDFNYDAPAVKPEFVSEDEPQETYRQMLAPHFFRDIEILKTLGEPENVRVVFWFDC